MNVNFETNGAVDVKNEINIIYANLCTSLPKAFHKAFVYSCNIEVMSIASVIYNTQTAE